MVVRIGAHTIKSTSNLQTSVGLHVSGAEYYALVHGAAHGLDLRSYFADLGLEMDVVIQSDSNAARAFASRRGLGKQRHVMTRFLWLQERVRCKHPQIVKIRTDDKCSDILTKSVSQGTLEKHMKSMSWKLQCFTSQPRCNTWLCMSGVPWNQAPLHLDVTEPEYAGPATGRGDRVSRCYGRMAHAQE